MNLVNIRIYHRGRKGLAEATKLISAHQCRLEASMLPYGENSVKSEDYRLYKKTNYTQLVTKIKSHYYSNALAAFQV